MILYPYQDTGRNFLACRPRAILADEPGLGKTAQAIMAMTCPAVIVCPAVVKSVWANMIRQWRPELSVHVHNGRNIQPVQADVQILNYEILPEKWENRIETLVADEAHALKSYKSARHQRFLHLQAARKWALTGTPILRNPLDMWGILSVLGIARSTYGSLYRFASAWDGRQNKWGAWEFGNLPSRDATAPLDAVMLRRLRKDVMADLPEKHHTIVPVTLPKSVQRMHDDALQWIDLDNLPDSIDRFAELRRATAEQKIGPAMDLVNDLDPNEPVIVWSAHTAPVKAFEDLNGFAIINGATSPNRRETVVTDFQNGKLRGLAINIKAGGVGITLTKASQAIFVDQEWSPGLNRQAEDRICRIGQTRGCNYLHLVATTELEERVWRILRQKSDHIATIGSSE